MNKIKSFIQSAGIALLVVIISLAVSPYLLPKHVKPHEISFADASRVTKEALEDKCASCHRQDASVPWLNNVLSAGLVESDMHEAVRRFDMGNAADETSLAKLQYAIGNGRMPPARYTVVHWGSVLSAEQVVSINKWINDMRARHFSNGLAAPAFAGEPIQPVPGSLPVNIEKVKLGKDLYNDTRLSKDNTVSCATCHAIDKAGTDNLPVSVGINKQKGGINAPTVFNAAFNFIQFWDGRAVDLKAQAGGPPLNPVEMGYESPSDWDDIVRKLTEDASFTSRFLAVYPQGYSADTITDAIAEYEKTLITPDSPFDKFLKGDMSAVGRNVKQGYYYFKKHGCYTCHVGTAMGGQSFEAVDLKGDFFGHRPLTGDDKGRMNFTKNEFDIHRFRVPTLRNVALTWPYMHDASCATLDEAVRKMFTYLVGVKKPDDTEVARIVDFLRAQTGQFEGRPVQGTPSP